MFALLGRRSRIPIAPSKQRRFSWSKKRICCSGKSSRLPNPPVPLLTMTESTKVPPRRKKAGTTNGPLNKSQKVQKVNKVLEMWQRDVQSSNAKTTARNGVTRSITATASSSIKTTSSSRGRERTIASKHNSTEKRKLVSSISSSRNRSKAEINVKPVTVKRTKVDGSSACGSSKRSALSTSRTAQSSINGRKPLANKKSERKSPRSFPLTQRRLQSPRSSLNKRPKTNKPIVRSNVQDRPRTKTCLTNSQLTTSSHCPGEERTSKPSTKPKGDRNSKKQKKPIAEEPQEVTRLESRPSVGSTRSVAKPEMSLWKRLKNQMTTQKNKTDSNSVGPKKRLSWRRRSDPGAKGAHTVDTDADSVSTGQPILAKGNPVDVFFPITPRSLTLTNAHADGFTTMQGAVLQRCTTLSPEPNPAAVFRQFQSCSESRTEQRDEELYNAEPLQETDADADASGRRVFTPAGIKVTQKDTTYSSASAEILRTHSSDSASPRPIEAKLKDSPSRIFSNPLLSPSPELPPCPTNLEIPVTMGMPELRIPNMPTHPRSEAAEASIRLANVDLRSMVQTATGGGTTRRLDSSQIEARCEWIRETLKEESQRLITMTTMLEGLQVSPRPAASVDFNCASNQDLNRRYIERINDLQLENRHLRQLLEFSIGSIRRQTWMPGPAPVTPCYGSTFTNPIAEIDCSAEATNKRRPMSKHANKEKLQRGHPEYVSRLKDSLDAKDHLLKVIDESYTQIASLRSWYDKRLSALETDKKRLQAERDEHLKVRRIDRRFAKRVAGIKALRSGGEGAAPVSKEEEVYSETGFAQPQPRFGASMDFDDLRWL